MTFSKDSEKKNIDAMFTTVNNGALVTKKAFGYYNLFKTLMTLFFALKKHSLN